MDKSEKIRKKKKAIIEALKRCLARDVYSRITVQGIADEAGFSKGGVLYYFPIKEQMYVELMEEMFRDIASDHERALKGNLKSDEKASISALYEVERFVLDRNTIKILINLVMYGFEEEKIMQPIRMFLNRHLEFYKSVINEARQDTPTRRKTDFEPDFIARIAQMTVLSAGFLESIEKTDFDSSKLIRYIISLFKG